MAKPRIIIAAGGTGGHIFPAEALVEEIQKAGVYEPFLLCDNRTLRFCFGVLADVKRVVLYSPKPKEGIFSKLLLASGTLIGMLQTIWLFFIHRPKFVIGFGGYPAFPAMLAAVLFRIPLWLHEQNAVMGRVNRWFAPFASKVSTVIPNTMHIPEGAANKVVCLGNPLREKIATLAKEAKYEFQTEGLLKLFIVGGSQGASIFSTLVPAAIKLLPTDMQSRLHITAQVRPELLEQTTKNYEDCLSTAKLQEFFENIHEILETHHLVIARAGASTVSELCAFGRPSILIPFAAAQDNHQYYNALYLESNNAALLIEEQLLTAETLSRDLIKLLSDVKALKQMSKNAKALAVFDAKVQVYNEIVKLIK